MKHLHPAVPFVYFIMLLVLVFTLKQPIFLITQWAGTTVLAFFFAGTRKMRRSLKTLLPFAVLMALLNPLLVHRGGTVLFYFMDNPITLEAAVFGFFNMFSLLAVLTIFISFNAVIDQSAFLYLTARWFPRLAFILDISLRSAFSFQSRAAGLIGVQKTRGIRIDKGRILNRAQTALMLLNVFTARCLEEGMETAEVLKARDYGTGPRTHYRTYRFGIRDVAWLAGILLIFGLLMLGCGMGLMRYEYYPLLKPWGLRLVEWGLYALLLIFLAGPMLP